MKAGFATWAARSAILAPVLLSGCSQPTKPNLAANVPEANSAPRLAAKPAETRIFTLDTPVSHIAADPQGKAVLDHDIPGLMASKQYPLFEDMSLSQIASLSHGRLSQNELDLVKSDLVQLSYLTPEPTAPTLNPPAQ